MQDVLGEPQVKISKHLGYLKKHGVLTVRREGYWRIYRLVAEPGPILRANLACLRDAAGEDRGFRRDLEKLKAIRAKIEADAPACCAAPRTLRLKTRRATA